MSKYTSYSVVWADGIWRCTDNPDEIAEVEAEENYLRSGNSEDFAEFLNLSIKNALNRKEKQYA